MTLYILILPLHLVSLTSHCFLMLQELRDSHEQSLERLDAVVTKLQQELVIEEKHKEASEIEVNKLEDEYKVMKDKVHREEIEHKREVSAIKQGYLNKISQLEKRSEKLAAENFEYAMEYVSLN